MKSSSEVQAIGHIQSKDLGPRTLWKLFESGSKAVCLHEDRRIEELWDRVVNQSSWKGFWNNGVLTFSRNHFNGKPDYGDLFWFEPETSGYIARKVVIFPDPVSGEIEVFPKTLVNDGGEIARLPQDTLKLAWSLAMDILTSALPGEDLNPAEFVVHLELLKYPDSHEELQRMFNLINAGSAWKKVGMKLDRARVRARGPFAKRFARDAYALLSILPGIGEGVEKANRSFGDPGYYEHESDYAPVGETHVDGCRFLTILASDRDVMKTEAYCGEKWHELPLRPDRFVIFPGTFFDPENRVRPTVHRYAIRKEEPKTEARKPNLTLVLGISTRKMFEERKPR